jgi:hypothetical protein
VDFNIGSAFGYIARDPNWTTKAGIGVGALLATQFFGSIPLLNLVIFPLTVVVGVAMLGYQIQIIRTVASGRDDELPEWTDLSKILLGGLILFLITLLWYLLPGILAAGGGIGLVVAAFGGPGGNSGNLEPADFLAGGMGLAAIFLLAGLALALVASFFAPMATLRYAVTLRFGEAFNLRGITDDMRRSLGSYLLILVLQVGLAVLNVAVVLLPALVLGMIPILGPALLAFLTAPLQFYTMVVVANVLGQYQRAYIYPLWTPAAEAAEAGPLPAPSWMPAPEDKPPLE